MNKHELIGKKYGKLTVLSVSDRKGKNGGTYFCCQCECGKETEVSRNNLVTSSTKSCGCMRTTSKTSKKVHFVISNRPSDTKLVTSEKIKEGKIRRSIESLQEKFALDRELSMDSW